MAKISITEEQLDSLVERKLNERLAARGSSRGDDEEPELALHRCAHEHGPAVDALLAIGAHVGLIHTAGGSHPFDVAIDKLVGNKPVVDDTPEE